MRLKPGQSAMTCPPRTAPPTRKAQPPVPWSVPRVPFTAAVRPNSVTTKTAVCGHSGPNPSASDFKPLSSPASRVARRPFGAALVGVGVPTAGLDDGNLRTAVAAHQFGRHARHRAHPIRVAGLRRYLAHHAAVRGAVHHFLGLHRFAQPRREPIVLGVQVRQARQQVLIDIRRGLRRFGNHRGLAAQDQWHILADGHGTIAGPSVRPLPRGNAASARLSQPSAVPMGLVSPFSSTF